MEKQRKRNNESNISQIVVTSLYIECFGVAAVVECSFLSFNMMGKEKNVHHSVLRNMFDNPDMQVKT